jgi:small subunit ribosomal protein S19
MSRSIKKGPYIDKNILKKIERLRGNKSEPIKTWARDCVISPEMIGFTFLVHNGKEFIAVKVQEAMVGHKLGEFSPTTKFFRHGGKMQREIEKKAVEKTTGK